MWRWLFRFFFVELLLNFKSFDVICGRFNYVFNVEFVIWNRVRVLFGWFIYVSNDKMMLMVVELVSGLLFFLFVWILVWLSRKISLLIVLFLCVRIFIDWFGVCWWNLMIVVIVFLSRDFFLWVMCRFV